MSGRAGQFGVETGSAINLGMDLTNEGPGIRAPKVALRRSLSNLTPIIDRVTSANAPVSIHDVRGEAKPAATIKRVRRLSTKERAELIIHYHSGQTVYQLADKYGIHRHTVSKHLRDAGVRLRLDGLTAQQIDEAVQTYESGLSLVSVAERFGVAPRTVLARPRERGVRMRDTHGRAR
jgi:DNA-binding CsgD family transcriptional regulator